MKMITINVDEGVYRRFQDSATRRNRSASELIREAMAEYADEILAVETSIFDAPPAQVGTIYPIPHDEEDLLDEMLR
ncbi:MAG: ribbon-helix-helix protein, CopG family [Alkalispirochaeta sp.]